MDTTIPYIRSQADLLAEIKILVRDPSDTRWTAVEKYAALNQVLMFWADKVKLGRVYTIPDGWQVSEYEYDLPSYIRPPIFPELLRRVPYTDMAIEAATSHWQDVPGYELVPSSTGGQAIRLYAPPRNLEGQVFFYAPNSRVPTTIPTTSGSTSATATTMTIGSDISAAIDDVGYVKVDSEIMSYTGVTRGSTTILNNLVRALHGTTAAIHNTATSCYWCVAMDDMSLNKVLFDMWKSALANYFIQDGGVHESSRHEKSMGYHDQTSMNFWAKYRPKRRTPDLQLNRKSFLIRR